MPEDGMEIRIYDDPDYTDARFYRSMFARLAAIEYSLLPRRVRLWRRFKRYLRRGVTF